MTLTGTFNNRGHMNTPRIVEMLTKGTQLKNFKCEKFKIFFTVHFKDYIHFESCAGD